jgi:hypothetical protein
VLVDDEDARLPLGSVNLLLDLRERLRPPADDVPVFSLLPDLVRSDRQDGRVDFAPPAGGLPSAAVLAGNQDPGDAAQIDDLRKQQQQQQQQQGKPGGKPKDKPGGKPKDKSDGKPDDGSKN